MSDLVIVSNEAKALGGHLNGFREAVQRHILRALAAAGFFQELAFVGGTALRIGHQLNRFSEDLDFAVLKPMTTDRVIEIGDTAFDALKQLKIVKSSSRDFRTIPMGGSRDKLDYVCHLDAKLPPAFRDGSATFTLRLDLDRNPANGWNAEPQLLRSGTRPFAVKMHDLPSLFAGKLHVLCCREDRAKGRDFFDLAWYLSQGIEPNLSFLQATINMLEPTPWPAEQWTERLIQRLGQVDFKRLNQDLALFLIDASDLMLMEPDLLTNELRKLNR
ncbi:nucleotidyl transferase AbiEii/AbiGii toxin family protein [Coraliomargarita sp. W4R53]